MNESFTQRVPRFPSDIGSLLLRVTAGSMMLTHGFPKLQYLLSGEVISFPDPFYITPTLSLGLAVVAEFLCSILVIIGLKTRYATVPIILTMLVAIFSIHLTYYMDKQELPLLYLSMFTCILIIGGGNYSIDQVIYDRTKKV